jgi:tellurite resistance protein
MVYVGTPERHGSREGEAAIIDPALAVSPTESLEAVPDLDYGPSYRDIRPKQRALFLRWLAGGRQDPRIPIGYVFLFFYGLEARLVIDGPAGLVSAAERAALIAELYRLLDIYGQNNSFCVYATELAELAECTQRTTPRYLEPPPTPRDAWTPSLSLRLGLGEMAAEAIPMPAPWAIAWLDADREVSLPTPARRCRSEWERLFALRYAKQYGAGIKLHASTRMLSISHNVASPGLRGTVTFPLGVPDVFALTGPRKKIAELAFACSSELDSFSRFVGKRPDERSSIEAIALLPMELAAEVATEWAAQVIASLEGPAITLPTSHVFRGKISKDLVIATQRLLEAKELGMEPDPRRGGPLPKEDGKIVLFRLIGPEGPATTEYVVMALLLQVAVTVAAADGKITAEEVEHLEGRIDAHLSFGPPERARLRAHLQWLVAERPGLTTLKKKLGSMTPTQRDLFADFLVGVAWADGAIATEEVKLLSKLFPLLGLDTAQVHRRIHAHAAANTPGARAPVKVASGAAEAGFAIPKPKSKKHPGGLDADLIAEKEAESAAVQDLLSSIFDVDDETEASPPPPPRPSTVTPEPPSTAGSLGALAGGRLSVELTAFARALAARAEWTKSEVDAIARDQGLMAGGALEKINDVAFDVCDQPFAIGDDPIEIDAAILEEILS